MKYKFKLQGLLRLREFREYQVKLKISQINKRIYEINNQIAREKKEIEESHNSMCDMVEAGISGEMISFFPYFIQGKEQRIKQLQEELVQRKNEYKETIAELSEARGEVKLIEKMKEKDFDKYKKELQKKEDKILEDLVQVNIYKKRKS